MLKVPFIERLREHLRFWLERQIQRGAGFQLLVIAATIGLVSFVAGLLAWEFTGKFKHLDEAIWWGFLRLTDPGYLGDDEGRFLRTLSTAVTMLGYVLFMGSLVAIMTQWLNRQIRELEQGFTPVALNGHVVILGWTDRAPEVVSELAEGAGRLRRFLEREGARRLRIVILVEDYQPEMAANLRQRLGNRWRNDLVIFRTGSALKPDHLLRADPANSAVIIIPSSDFATGGRDRADTRAIKTLLSLQHPTVARGMTTLPPVVVEVGGNNLDEVARGSCEFPVEVLAGDPLLSRLIAQSCLHRAIWAVLQSLLSRQGGDSLLVRELPSLAGTEFRSLASRFPRAIPIGFLRQWEGKWEAILNPRDAATVRAEDLIVFVASSYNDCEPGRSVVAEETPANEAGSLPALKPDCETLLILGWGRKLEALLDELAAQTRGSFSVTVVSRVSAEERIAHLTRAGRQWEQLDISHVEADYANPAGLAALNPARFDRIVMMSSDWLPTAEDADARTVLGFVLLRSALASATPPPPVLVELMDPENAGLFDKHEAEVIVSPRVMSHFLAQVAMRSELQVVFDELFGPGGAEFAFRDAREFSLTGKPVRFPEVQRATARLGETAIGLAGPGVATADGFVLNPPRETAWDLKEADRIIVLTTHS